MLLFLLKKKISKNAVQIINDSIKELEQRNICKFKDEEKSSVFNWIIHPLLNYIIGFYKSVNFIIIK